MKPWKVLDPSKDKLTSAELQMSLAWDTTCVQINPCCAHKRWWRGKFCSNYVRVFNSMKRDSFF